MPQRKAGRILCGEPMQGKIAVTSGESTRKVECGWSLSDCWMGAGCPRWAQPERTVWGITRNEFGALGMGDRPDRNGETMSMSFRVKKWGQSAQW